MAVKQKLSPEQLDQWKASLAEATARLNKKRDEAAEAELDLRTCILAAFAAGLSVTPIMEATGYSLGRVYQIKRGTRR